MARPLVHSDSLSSSSRALLGPCKSGASGLISELEWRKHSGLSGGVWLEPGMVLSSAPYL